jgi:hypothetical protein
MITMLKSAVRVIKTRIQDQLAIVSDIGYLIVVSTTDTEAKLV